jgi:hypothetical protein
MIFSLNLLELSSHLQLIILIFSFFCLNLAFVICLNLIFLFGL